MRLAKVLRITCALLLLSIVGPGSFAVVTSLRVESETGDTADGEKLNFYSSEDGHLKLLPPSPGDAGASEEVNLEFVRPLRPGWPKSFSWRLWFTAPPGETLAVGLYDDAVVPFRRDAGQPGLQVYEEYDGAYAIIVGRQHLAFQRLHRHGPTPRIPTGGDRCHGSFRSAFRRGPHRRDRALLPAGGDSRRRDVAAGSPPGAG